MSPDDDRFTIKPRLLRKTTTTMRGQSSTNFAIGYNRAYDLWKQWLVRVVETVDTDLVVSVTARGDQTK
jgi:hypothetical protein